MKHKLDESLEKIQSFFKEGKPYVAHEKSHQILSNMASDREVIFEVLRRNMTQRDFSEKEGTIDFQICLFDRPDCTMFASFFGPNQNQDTSVTYSTMHDHDDAILSTVSAFGPGYKSLIFKKWYELNKDTNEVKIELEKFIPHSPGNIEFIDAQTAHSLFFPESISLTYALWCNYLPISRLAKLKARPIIQKNKAWIKKLIKRTSVNVESIGIPQQLEDYFYPENGKMFFLPKQIPGDTSVNWIENYFHIIQYIGFDDKRFLKSLYDKQKTENNPALPWVDKLIAGEKIERNYSNLNFYIPKRNVSIDEFRKCYNF